MLDGCFVFLRMLYKVNTMSSASRFTTEFIDFEDRLRISAAVTEQQVDVVWLTRRLLDRLVTHLGKQLEQTLSAEPRPEAASMRQSFEQQAAVASYQQQSQQQPTPRVDGQSAAFRHEWLVIEVDITPHAQGIGLRFRGRTAEQVLQLTMTAVQLRQWLAIIHSQYVKAQWPMDAWPTWVNDQDIQSVPGESANTVWH